MKPAAIAICILCQFCLVVGQLFLKRGMAPATPSASGRGLVSGLPSLAAGIGLLSAWFFLWLGLLQRWELSQLFPFEGLNPALIVLGAWLFLRERVPLYAWVGIALISAGVALVSMN